jgi:hypothetical protein
MYNTKYVKKQFVILFNNKKQNAPANAQIEYIFSNTLDEIELQYGRLNSLSIDHLYDLLVKNIKYV